MPIDKQQFWGENYYNHSPLTAEAIAVAEITLGVKFPALLLELLQVQNGGYTIGFAFPMKKSTSWSDTHVPLHELFGIVEDASIDTAQNILDTPYLTEEWGLPEKQVLLTGDGHWWITLDYRGGDTPTIKWFGTESEEEVEVAKSFEEFINGLVPMDRNAE